MMRKTIIVLGFLMIILLILGRMTLFSDEALISQKVISTGDLLSSQRVDELDKYLSDTRFIHNNKIIGYDEAKENMKEAFINEKIHISLYCTSIGVKSNKAVSIIFGDVVTEKDGSIEMDIKAKFQRTGIFNWRIVELKSNDDMFKHLFFGGNSKG